MSNKNIKIKSWEDAFRLLPPLLEKFNKEHKTKFRFVDSSGYYYEELHAICIQFYYQDKEDTRMQFLIDNSDMTTNEFMKVVKGLYEKHKKEDINMSNKEVEPEWLTRVKVEKKELAEKISKLSKYLGENSDDDCNLLSEQLNAMVPYLNVLNRRIERYNWDKEFNKNEKEEN